MIADEPSHHEGKGQGIPAGRGGRAVQKRERGTQGVGDGHTGGQGEGARAAAGGVREVEGWPHQPLSCDPSSSTPTTTLQKSEVSRERFITVAEEPAARRCVASMYL